VPGTFVVGDVLNEYSGGDLPSTYRFISANKSNITMDMNMNHTKRITTEDLIKHNNLKAVKIKKE
jgi:hypothetical protein